MKSREHLWKTANLRTFSSISKLGTFFKLQIWLKWKNFIDFCRKFGLPPSRIPQIEILKMKTFFAPVWSKSTITEPKRSKTHNMQKKLPILRKKFVLFRQYHRFFRVWDGWKTLDNPSKSRGYLNLRQKGNYLQTELNCFIPENIFEERLISPIYCIITEIICHLQWCFTHYVVYF